MLAKKLFCFLQSAESGQVNIQSHSMNTCTAKIDLQSNRCHVCNWVCIEFKIAYGKKFAKLRPNFKCYLFVDLLNPNQSRNRTIL